MKNNSLLVKTLSTIHKRIGRVKKLDYQIIINADPEKITLNNLKLLHFLLNNFEGKFFIVIKGVPFCLMPTAKEHLVYPARKELSNGVYEKGNEFPYRQDKVCRLCGFKNSCCGWSKKFTRISREKIRPPKDLPGEIVFELTTSCNLNCLMCTKIAKRISIPEEKIMAVLSEAKKIGVKAVRFTGGEPFLDKNIYRYLTRAKEKGFYVILNTTLSVLERKNIARLKGVVDNMLISLQGYNQATDKKITRADYDFVKKIQNIYQLTKLIPRVRLGTVITETLVRDFKQYYRLVKNFDLALWELYRPLSIKEHSPAYELNVSKNELCLLLDKIRHLRKQEPKIPVKIANPLPFCLDERMTDACAFLIGALADDGHSRIVLDARGFFKPSYFLNKKLGTTIAKAWQNPWLKKIRSLDWLPEQCQKCFYRKWCKGGSRVAAYLCYGDYFKPDPLTE